MPLIVLFSRVREWLSVSILLRYFSVLTFIFLIADPAYADISSVMANLQVIIAPLTVMVLWISYVAGIFFIFRAILHLKKLGMGQAQGDWNQPLLYLFVGTVLICLPAATDVTMTSLFGQTASLLSGGVNYAGLGQGQSLLSYVDVGGVGSQWASLANTLVLYLQFLGFLSFIKGWFIIAKSGTPSNQGGGIAKGISHIVSGIALINIVGVVNILQTTIMGG